MSVFFTKYIAVVLMVISIVQSTNRIGTDEEIVESCQDMLSTFFSDGQNDGLLNFIQAFQRLSKQKIQEHFKEPTEEEGIFEATERLTSLQLNMTYFESLLNTNGIQYVQCEDPESWCQNEAQNLMGEFPAFADKNKYGRSWREPHQLYDLCRHLVLKISRNFTRQNLTHDAIMQIIYLDFSEDMMHYAHIMGKESRSHDPEKIKYNTYFLNKFAKPFYDCYVTLLMHNIGNLTGPYNSVPNFCEYQGMHIIKDFKGLGYGPFL